MSSRKSIRPGGQIDRRRAVVLLGSALLSGPLVAACQPLYGPTPSGVALKDVMAGIEIATIPGRVGQRVRNELIFATTRGGYAGEPVYRLDIIVRELVGDLLVEQTGNVQGQMFYLDTQFELLRLSDKKVVLKGKSASRAAYDRFESVFTNTRARVDAENRAASTVADGIRTRLAAFLSSAA